MKEINDILMKMAPISLSEMSAVKLMNRVDTKYVTDDVTVTRLFSVICDDYFVQEIEGKRIAAYDSVYYDTADNHMYIIHQDKKLKRDKLRIRNYVDTGNYFCEVKHKNNKGRTKKKRIEVSAAEFADISKNAALRDFVEKELPQYEFIRFEKKLETAFDRITLVNKGKTERITIDFNVSFHCYENGNNASLAPNVVIELKRDGRCESVFQKTLLDLRVKPFSISKYCIGRALTDKNLKQNRFKKKIIKLEKLKKIRKNATFTVNSEF